MKRITVFKLTNDDWYPSYTIQEWYKGVRLQRMIELSQIELGYDKTWRVCAWGGDDFGLERDFVGEYAEQESSDIFILLLEKGQIDTKDLTDLGFIYT